MKKNFLYIIAFLSVLVACTEEKIEVGTPLTGQEVTFSVSMGNDSRTIYGAEETDGKSIKVNWVNGDKITVFGTTCAVQQADYSVVAANSGNQNYADDLQKTGAAGVQWGSEPSDFYAIYPAVDEAIEMTNGIVTINTSVRQFQNNDFVFNSATNTWVGTPYMEGSVTNTMPDALMYAMTPGVSSTDKNGIVDLNFKPFSTVLKFTLDGFTVKNNTTGEVVSDAEVYVSKITVKAPYYVTGACSFTFDSSTPTVEGGEYNDIVIYPKSLPLKQGQKLEFSAFAIPSEYTISNSEDATWTVEIETTNYGTHTYLIQPTVPQTLLAGQIHKVKIPAIVSNRGEVTLPAENWVRWIPRNVYLSELSMPGAWYCMDGSYQNNATLEELFAAGVRAFNIDCRVSREAFRALSSGNPWKSDSYENGNFHFACAGTEEPTTVTLWGAGYSQMKEGTHVLDAVKTLVKLANNHPHEIIAIIFTFAEKPSTEGSVGSTLVYGSTDPQYITAELKKVLEDSSISPFIYKDINSETTISDLLAVPEGATYPRNILVKINHSNKEFYSNYPLPDGVMTSFGSMAMEGWVSDYIASISALDANYYRTMQNYPIYIGGGNTIADTEQNGMTYYFCQAQKTYNSGGGVPTIEERKTAINNVLMQAKSVYDNSQHNALFQLGIGGSLNDNQLTVAQSLNPYVSDIINNMLATRNVSPLGFVLMNHCLSTYNITVNGETVSFDNTKLLQDIISFNAKFYLNRDKEKPEWPDGNPYNENGEENPPT